jgi:hypothetical protein
MIGEVPLRLMPVEIQWLGTGVWTFELGRDDRYLERRSGWATPGKAAGDMTREKMGEVLGRDTQPAVDG